MVINMAFDGITAYALNQELRELLTDGRIEKIYQPEKDEIILNIHTKSKKIRLVCCCNANYPRVHITEHTKENPMSAPMFCMLLRKHIQSGRITNVCDMGLERMVMLEIETFGELGDKETKHLIVEIMGHYSNIILTNGDHKIIDSMKRVDLTVSTVRQVLPGHTYSQPPSQNKICPLNATYETILKSLMNPNNKGRMDKILLNSFEGLSPIICREIVYRSFGDTTVYMENSDPEMIQKLAFETNRFFNLIKEKKFDPVILYDENTGKPFDFSTFVISQYENLKTVHCKPSISEAMDEFYTQKDHAERLTQKKSSLHKTLMNLLDRCSKKLILQEQSLKDSQNKDEYKLKGDLLFANLYHIPNGCEQFVTENFYNQNEPIKIELDKSKTPSQNANHYYNLYNKAKNTETAVIEQLKKSQDEMDYLESVYEALKLAQNDTDIAEIKDELALNGFIRRPANYKSAKKVQLSKPLCFKSTDGYFIMVGKNNRQNDQLTLKSSKNSDLWFHTKNIPGSHTVIVTNGEKVIPQDTILQAAVICAYHSKARQSSKVPVDYTWIRNVKKPNGAKPGMVIYENNKTIYATPDENLIRQLKVDQP